MKEIKRNLIKVDYTNRDFIRELAMVFKVSVPVKKEFEKGTGHYNAWDPEVGFYTVKTKRR